MADDFRVDFPVLWVALDWVERHCVIPDGFRQGQPFVLPEWQLWFFANHYRVKPEANLVDDEGNVMPARGASAFYYRRSQVIMPQKIGKGPMSAAHTCLEGVGPAMFAGWAKGGEEYRCQDHGCPCGWVYAYAPGEPMGTPWPTPLIQITAFSEEQTGNVFDALRPMILKGPLDNVIPRVTEDFIRLPGGGRIDAVTSSAQSRLGQRVTFVLQDETQLWTEVTKMVKVATTQRRGAAGMDGRVCETTNAYDPAENSVAQQTAEAAMPDVFRLHRQAPHHLSYTSKAERRRIHAHVYAGSPWVNLDTIEGEAAELIAKGDPGQAERFFGNRIVAGSGQWMDDEDWAATEDAQRVVPEGTEVCGGFDGSENDDWTAIRLETFDGFGFTPTYGPDARPTVWNPKEWGGKIPKGEVHAAWSELARRYKLVRVYCDPPYWDSEIGDWAQLYGEETFVEWPTYRPRAMYDSLIRMRTDVGSRRRTHDACPFAKTHMSNTRKAARPGDMYLLSKPSNHQKIDVAMTDTLAHEAASDARAEGWAPGSNTSRVLVFR